MCYPKIWIRCWHWLLLNGHLLYGSTRLQLCVVHSVMQSDGNSCKFDTFRESITSVTLWIHLNSENISFVSSKSYYFRTCINVWFISCRLKKIVRFRTFPIWMHHTVTLLDLNLKVLLGIQIKWNKINSNKQRLLYPVIYHVNVLENHTCGFSFVFVPSI